MGIFLFGFREREREGVLGETTQRREFKRGGEERDRREREREGERERRENKS